MYLRGKDLDDTKWLFCRLSKTPIGFPKQYGESFCEIYYAKEDGESLLDKRGKPSKVTAVSSVTNFFCKDKRFHS